MRFREETDTGTLLARTGVPPARVDTFRAPAPERFAREAPPAPDQPAPGRPSVARLYAAYALAFLAVTLLSGAWLRSAFVWQDALGGFSFRNALHAHSHVAFFGWTTMALFAVIVAAAPPRREGWLRAHAHLVGLGSAAAFVGFLQSGYAPHTIALSSLHVLFWVAFVLGTWERVEALDGPPRGFFRAALVFLALAGVGALTPGVVVARGIFDPWINQLSIQFFLTPFVSGWLLLGIMGAAYARLRGGRWQRWALGLVAAGVFPSVFLHVAAPPPVVELLLVGRVGTLLIGAGTLLFARDVLRHATDPLLLLIGAAALAKGVTEIVAAIALPMGTISSRPLTIAYLHLVLLAMITPALLAALEVRVRPAHVTVFAAGIAVMLTGIVATGWPALLGAAAALGVSPVWWFRIAFVGGVASALALLPALAGGAGPVGARRRVRRHPEEQRGQPLS
jgi:hypothetical protein